MTGDSIRRRTVLTGAAAFAAAQAIPGSGARAQTRSGRSEDAVFAYVGAFTTPQRKGHGHGINAYRMDRDSGDWTHIQLLSDIENPSFLTLDRQQRFLYSVHADLEQVRAYSIDKASGRLSPLNRQSCGGKNPVYLTIDPSGRFIVTANYTGGSVGVVPIEKDGSLGAMTDVVSLKGEPGPNRKEQASSHPHDAPFDPGGRFITVPDKGLDRIFVFRLDTGTGKLHPNDPPFAQTQVGAGPRHIAFHPTLPFA
jgi:6-phosphogluconolactonase